MNVVARMQSVKEVMGVGAYVPTSLSSVLSPPVEFLIQ